MQIIIRLKRTLSESAIKLLRCPCLSLIKSNAIPGIRETRIQKFKQQKSSITQHPSPENLTFLPSRSKFLEPRGSRERKTGRHRDRLIPEKKLDACECLEEDWDIPFYRESSGCPFMKLPLRNIPLWKRLLRIVPYAFPSPPPRSANGTKREGAREASASYYWNYGRSDARKSKFPRFFFHRPLHCLRFIAGKTPPISRRWRNVRGRGGTGDSRAAIRGLGQGKQVRR